MVFFHVGGHNHPFVRVGVDYDIILRNSIDAARSQHADANIVLLTNSSTDVSAFADRAKVVRLHLDADLLMYSRMRSYRALAAAQKLSGPVMFLDTDVHLNRSFDGIFTNDFDIGLTYRNEVGQWHMPINEGVILSPSAEAPALRGFFDATLSLYETIASEPAPRQRYGFDIRRWRGGQLSLAKFINWSCPPLAPDLRAIGGVRVKFLPCAKYNYAVSTGETRTALREKWALHYKGAVKASS